MSTKEEASPGENLQQVDQSPPVVTRTRSGRRVRTPAALLDSQVAGPVRAPGRRTRRSVLQEELGKNTNAETETEKKDETKAEPTPVPCSESESTEPCSEPGGDPESLPQDTRPAPVETAPACPDNTAQRGGSAASSGKHSPAVPLGKPKSGRVWKDRSKQRFSALVRDKPLRTSWEKKMEAKREKELVKKYSLQLVEEKARAKEEKRKRREENLKRRAENERKAEIVQVIRNTAKIKRMKKKQLRKIEKRDTLNILQKSQPPKSKS
ncbi:coiled-coil domain-containing protein 86 [Myripristis murdjan]|uniref:Coiled-coil domain-containing protein 86 n=1 Tax=Myripristis murdjan TaxID=586833 RepID=A0A667Y3P4_9TELE|nr:coiled-coil domain-containing protein 86 [Myripristis murdjan]